MVELLRLHEKFIKYRYVAFLALSKITRKNEIRGSLLASRNFKVNTIVQTYNQEKFLDDCLSSIFTQTLKSFVIILDDASIDKSKEIAIKYYEKFPKQTLVISRKRNARSRGISNLATMTLIASGDLIAYCDGDDFWVDKTKLEKQVLVFNKDNSVGLVHHQVNVLNQTVDDTYEKLILDVLSNQHRNRNYDDGKVLISGNFVMTNSAMLRRRNLSNRLLSSIVNVMPVDWVLFTFASLGQRIVYLPEIMSTYRIYGKNLWASSQSEEREKISESAKKFITENLSFEYKSVNSH